jgi:HEPN domain-containing protein
MADEAADLRVLEVRGWLLRAYEDIRAGRHDLTAVPPLLNDVAFHAQQCAEKSMKALLVHREHAFRKTHNLTELGGAVARLEPTLAELMRTTSLMTDYAWRFRYPGDQASVSHADAVQAIETAERVLEAISQFVPAQCWLPH